MLGATAAGIAGLVSREFVWLAGGASVLSCPVAFLLVQRWLQNFAYRVDLSIWIFLSGGAAAIAIAIITVSFHSLKAALANPVEALRYE